jgi:hypothetical protein
VGLYRAILAGGLAAAGRLDEAEPALRAARRELDLYDERFAEPLVLEAEARVRHARGEDPEAVAAVFAGAAALAHDQAAHGIAGRVERAARLCAAADGVG